MAYTATIMRKGTRVEVAETIREYWELVFDGFLSDGEAPDLSPPPFSAAQTEALAATIATALDGAELGGSNPLGRVAWKMAQGLPVKIVGVGDSITEGNTTTTPGTDDFLSLLAAEWSTQYGVTVTKSNRAVSGRTAQTSFTFGDFASAIADAGDLYTISFGHNDLRSDYSTPGTGYPKAAMVRSMEKMIRRVRDEVPQADILLILQNPYTPAANTSNPYLEAQNDLLRPLAAFYGVAVADAYTPFIDLGDFSALMWDTGHPNTAGHRVIADTIKALLPTGQNDPGAVTPPPGGSLYSAATVARTWESPVANDATASLTKGARYVLSGTWSSSTTAPHTSSTAGALVRVLSYGDECVLRLDCGAGQGVVTIDVDQTPGAYVIDLSTYPSGQRYLPLTGLGKGAHKIEVNVTSGSVTFRGAEARARFDHSIDLGGAKVVPTGTWTLNSSLATSVHGGKSQSSTTLGDSLAFTIFGTGLVLAHNRYSSNHFLEYQVDGSGVWTSVNVTSAVGVGEVYGPSTIVSGLPLGAHTIQVRSTGARASLSVYDAAVLDETSTGYRRDVDLAAALRSVA